jgi:hypothetical protein
MINLTINAAKAGFFDRAAVIDAADKATRGVLSKSARSCGRRHGSRSERAPR